MKAGDKLRMEFIACLVSYADLFGSGLSLGIGEPAEFVE